MFVFMYKLKPLVPFNSRGCRPFCAFLTIRLICVVFRASLDIRHVKHTKKQKDPELGKAEIDYNHQRFDPAENTFSWRRLWRNVSFSYR